MTSGPPIDLLSLFGRFGREQRISLRDFRAIELFMESAKASVAEALSNDALLHGQRTQNMFEALVVSLGRYKLLKTEDTGRVHPEGSYTAPDFRVVLRDGTQWLIEVKNVYEGDPLRQRLRLRKADFAKMAAYAATVQCPLKFALYWARWRIWALVDCTSFEPEGDKLAIDMIKAVQLSELAQLGDRTIGTTPPLTLRLMADPSKPRAVAPDGEVMFTINDAKIFCGDDEITDSLERNIAWIFMQYGDWQCSEPHAVLSDELLDGIEFVWTPREPANDGENFEMIGTLSAMFSRYYAEQTLKEDGIVQTEADLIPDWLAPLVDREHKTKTLPLWIFVIQPSPAAGQATEPVD
jgi:hypothetical protein